MFSCVKMCLLCVWGVGLLNDRSTYVSYSKTQTQSTTHSTHKSTLHQSQYPQPNNVPESSLQNHKRCVGEHKQVGRRIEDVPFGTKHSKTLSILTPTLRLLGELNPHPRFSTSTPQILVSKAKTKTVLDHSSP